MAVVDLAAMPGNLHVTADIIFAFSWCCCCCCIVVVVVIIVAFVVVVTYQS